MMYKVTVQELHSDNLDHDHYEIVEDITSSSPAVVAAALHAIAERISPPTRPTRQVIRSRSGLQIVSGD